MNTTTSVTGERADLLASLGKHRHFLRYTTRGLTDEQAATRTTVSELCIGGLIKHVAMVEKQWAQVHRRGTVGDEVRRRRRRCLMPM